MKRTGCPAVDRCQGPPAAGGARQCCRVELVQASAQHDEHRLQPGEGPQLRGQLGKHHLSNTVQVVSGTQVTCTTLPPFGSGQIDNRLANPGTVEGKVLRVGTSVGLWVAERVPFGGVFVPVLETMVSPVVPYMYMHMVFPCLYHIFNLWLLRSKATERWVRRWNECETGGLMVGLIGCVWTGP